jgi:hypothetical protein
VRPNGIGGFDTETGIVHAGYKIFGLTVRKGQVHGDEVVSTKPLVGAVIKIADDEKK